MFITPASMLFKRPIQLSREEALGLDKSKKRFDIREEYYLCSELSISALRYLVSLGGVTLMFIHGVSGHKEQYHTAITRLLSLRDVATHDIREIWLIDFPNHGEAATLNRRLLRAKIDTDEYKAHSGKDEGIWSPRSIHGTANVRGARAKRDTWSSRSLDIGSRGAERVFGLDGTREYSISTQGRGSGYTCQAHTIEPSQFAAIENGKGKDLGCSWTP
ncbi:hypothetical protein EV363DRAFT_1422325 [Boletus edulis]|nr:hypothetical protein EV363DRAFT_1422325 [Boletus edulis]